MAELPGRRGTPDPTGPVVAQLPRVVTRRCRMVSESSNFDGLEEIRPLELDDLKSYGTKDSEKAEVSGGRRPRRLRIRVNECDDGPIILAPVNRIFLATMQLRRQLSGNCDQSVEATGRARRNWRFALRGMCERGDPWADIHWDEIRVENAVRYRYNPLTKKWYEELVVVKMDEETFGKGAMRECFRMKKLSNFSHNVDWHRNSNNYVAKSYMEEVSRETYYQDVKLQMDAKLWGEEFNRHNPPKKVDVFMMAVLEFHERPNKPLFHVEHFIDGDYVKYNSNSGFVEESMRRQTPNAFSHFTFERSGHELIVVDVQGVGDLYTDPQIHTADGLGYGDGNLGTKGMALFFHSHSCNGICKSLGLSKFDLTVSEKKERVVPRLASQTVVRGQNVLPCESPSDTVKGDFAQFFRQRAKSNTSLTVDIAAAKLAAQKIRRQRTHSDYCSMEEIASSSSSPLTPSILEHEVLHMNSDCLRSDALSGLSPLKPRVRNMTESSDDSGIVSSKEMISFHEVLLNKAKPSNVTAIEKDELFQNESVLGNVHLDLAKYHETSRFSNDGTLDKEAALFHLKCAADCGIVTAMVTLAKMYFGLPHDILSQIEPNETHTKIKSSLGYRYMEAAAKAGDRDSMVFIARALDSGLNLDDPAKRSAKAALEWYEKICAASDAEADCCMEWGMDDAPYVLMARQAEIWLLGDANVKKDPNRAGDLYNEAAESAMACMKGKLANKYYMLAEEAYGQGENEE